MLTPLSKSGSNIDINDKEKFKLCREVLTSECSQQLHFQYSARFRASLHHRSARSEQIVCKTSKNQKRWPGGMLITQR